MKVTSEVKCPGCGGGIHLVFQRPGLLENRVVTTKCSLCESDVLFKFVKPAKQETKNTFRFSSKVVIVSQALIELRKEEEEWNKKSLEELEKENP